MNFRSDHRNPFGEFEWQPQTLPAIGPAGFEIIVCWLMGGSVYAEQRMLSGPLWAFNTTYIESAVFAIVATAFLLPCIFAVGIWRNKATVTLSILGCLAWVVAPAWACFQSKWRPYENCLSKWERGHRRLPKNVNLRYLFFGPTDL